MNNFNDCYKYLEVNYDTPFEDIQKKYRTKAKELHPDLNPNIDSTEQFQKLNNCFNYIKNNYSKYKANDEEIEFEYGFKFVVRLGSEEVDINKYKKDLSKLSCQCPDWLERRSNFSIKDPRRLCKHLIASFEKKDSVLNIGSLSVELLLKNYQSMIKIPNALLQYSDAIYSFFDIRKGFDLYWHNDIYETNNIIIYYKIKSTYTSAANIYLKGHDFEISCRFEHYYNLEKYYVTVNNVLFSSVGLGIFIKFCNQNILNDIKIFVSKYDKFETAFNRLLDYYNNDYYKYGRKFLKNVEELTKLFESNNYYIDNLSQVSDTSYFSLSYFISEKLYKIKEQHMSKYDELKNILNTNPQYKLNTRSINIILNKLGVIKKYKELNNNNWIIDNTYEKFGINFIKYTDKQNNELPSWYSTYYYNTYNLQIEKYHEHEKLLHTKILFKKNIFEELYQMCLNFQATEEKQKTHKKRSIKQYEDREYWIDNVECPHCKNNNLHKKDKRETKTNTIQRFYCNDCKKMFQIDYTEFSEIIKDNKEKAIKYAQTKDKEIDTIIKVDESSIKNSILEDKVPIEKKVKISKETNINLEKITSKEDTKKHSFFDKVLNLFK